MNSTMHCCHHNLWMPINGEMHPPDLGRRKMENKIKMKWVTPQDGRLPEKCLPVSTHQNFSQYIALDNSQKGSPVIRAISPNEEFSGELQLLVANERDFVWKPMQPNGLLPTGAVRAAKGNHGNIYIGHLHGSGIGTVKIPDGKGKWTYWRGEEDCEDTRGPFLVLCSI